jgi:hypothetical protein
MTDEFCRATGRESVGVVTGYRTVNWKRGLWIAPRSRWVPTVPALRLDCHEDRPSRCQGSARRPRRGGPPVTCRNARVMATEVDIFSIGARAKPRPNCSGRGAAITDHDARYIVDVPPLLDRDLALPQKRPTRLPCRSHRQLCPKSNSSQPLESVAPLFGQTRRLSSKIVVEYSDCVVPPGDTPSPPFFLVLLSLDRRHLPISHQQFLSD